MGRYHRIEARAYQQGVLDASTWLREFLRNGGQVAVGSGWDTKQIAFRDANGNIRTSPALVPEINRK